MAKTVNRKKHIIKWSIIMAVIAAVVIAVNCVAMSPTFYGIITMAFGGARYETTGGGDVDAEYYTSAYDSHDAAIAGTEATIIPEAVTEGVVLLENDDDLLPLAASAGSKAKISLFGYDSINIVVGGTGSGQSVGKVDMKSALESDNFEVNPDVWNASAENADDYSRGAVDVVYNTADFHLDEFPSSIYAGAESSYASYDTAVYMIGRAGGEAFDLPREMNEWEGDAGRHYLELTSEEESLLSYICGKFDKVVVIINTAGNMFETGRIETILDNAARGNTDFESATMFVAGMGSTGANGLGDVLSGAVSPSGRMTDTWLRDITADPSYVNSGDFRYSDLDNVSYVEYEEGIYVGYRYYETMDAIKNDGGAWYDSAVAYPFGYGLSYTTFTQTMSDITADDEAETISFDVTVTNTGESAGKEVVQIYSAPPYSAGGTEKAEKVLLDFAKTDTLDGGASATIKFTIPVEELASYDYKTEKAYVLDAGEYTISAGKNAHEDFDAKTVELDKKVYSGENKRASDSVAATNRFDDMNEYMEKATEPLTRADGFAGGVSAPESGRKLPVYESEYCDMPLSEMLVSKSPEADYTYDASVWSGSDMTFGEDGELELIQLRGKAYDDPMWDDLLDQVTEREAQLLIGTGGYKTQKVDSISKPATKNPDGPAGFTSFMDASIKGSSIPAATLIACTWNKDIAERLGEAIGEEGLAGGYSGWYAPATNMHRYALGGRNFEYYSEDPVLAGHMTTYVVQGAASRGVYSYIKHFALNEQETNRKTNNNVATWADEQAIREIYLKPFEMCVKNARMELKYLEESTDAEGNTTYTKATKEMRACTAVMSSYNRIGALWAGARYGLMTLTLRDEWGFEGMVITDYFSTEPQNMTQMLRTGNDLALTTIAANVPMATAEDKAVARNAVHNILYTVVNSNAMNGYSFGVRQVELMPVWAILMITISAVIGAAWLAWAVILVLDATGKTHIVYIMADGPADKKKDADGHGDN